MHFSIDPTRCLVTTVGEGRVTFADVDAHQKGLLAHPDFDPSYDQIVDFTCVTDMAISADEIRTLAARPVFHAKSRRVGIAPHDLPFGLMRMFEMYWQDSTGGDATRIVRSLDEALVWLHQQS
jgi:hypothetical protein